MDNLNKTATAEVEPSNYTGSKTTFDMVLKQIRDRWPSEAENYDPYKNCFTYKEWVRRGYRVRRGERSLQSVTWVEGKDKKTGEEKKFPKKIFLFFKTQVDPV